MTVAIVNIVLSLAVGISIMLQLLLLPFDKSIG